MRYWTCPGNLFTRTVGLLGLIAWATICSAAADDLPIREITVFKDGHAFVLHQGVVAIDQHGEAVLDHLPAPVIGTFWAYSGDPKTRLDSVVAGRRLVSVTRTPLTRQELLEANVGARVLVSEHDQQEYQAKILGVPVRAGSELGPASDGANSRLRLPERGQLVQLEIAEGVKFIAIDRITGLTFLDPPQGKLLREEIRGGLRLRFDWGGKPARSTTEAGMVYLLRGVRWIPGYRVSIDGAGSARLRLQATLVNELADLKGVTAHLVVGVPSFAFADTPDPISMQETVARLSSTFERESQTAYAFSNAIMTQQIALPGTARQAEGERPSIDLGPDIATAGKHEDLFVFTIDRITLNKGERMVVPVAELTLPYQDVFKLELPYGPPLEVGTRLNNDQQTKLARLFQTPKVKHNLRLHNTSGQPLTTGPALILKDGRLLAQGMITYTATGATSDLEVTAAVDISARRSDREVERTADAYRWSGSSFDRIDLEGTLLLVNHHAKTVSLEVQRWVLGHIDGADRQGTIEQGSLADGGWLAVRPWWWSWYSWPHWWYRMNPTGLVEWKLKLEPEQQVELTYLWHYFWD